jgi:tRNA A37 threonylcarbamoyladenosine modification protein TsaB
VPVSLLEALALANGKQGEVLAALDAGRGEVYAGEYEIDGESANLRREHLIAKEALLSAALGVSVSTPDSLLADFLRQAGRKVFQVETISAEMIAGLGWRKLQARQTVTPEQLEANYIRRSDAEIFAKRSS